MPLTYEEFFAEVVRLYSEEDNGEFLVMHLANEYPDYYERYAREEGLVDEEETEG